MTRPHFFRTRDVKVLHCIPSMEGGGAERQLAYLARDLAVAGCDVHVALARGGPNMPRLEASGATIHMLGPYANHDPRIAVQLLRTIRTVRPDLVQCWLLQMEILGGLVSLLTGTPWIFAERSCASAYPPTVKNLLRVRMAAFASGIVSNSTAGDEYWRRRAAGVPRYVIPNALPLNEIDGTPAATLEEAGSQSGEALIMCAGRLDAAKNAKAFVQAIHQLPPSASLTAVLCGDGPMRLEIEAVVRGRASHPDVRLIGYTPRLWSLIKRAAALVAPSRFEGSPNVVLEAMACGCPLIVSDIPAHRELLDETCAIFADDAESIADAIQRILQDPAAAAQRAALARVRVSQHASDLVAARHIAMYEDVAARHPRGYPEVVL